MPMKPMSASRKGFPPFVSPPTQPTMATLETSSGPITNTSSSDSTPSDGNSPSASNGDERKRKIGRHSRFTATEDLIIVREVAAAGAHVAQYCQTRALYEQAAEKCNGNRSMMVDVSWKQVQDRCTRLQEFFDKDDTVTLLRSGIGGGKLSELNELLSQMKEARDDVRQRKNVEKEKVTKDEEDKERIGRDLVAAATSRQKKIRPDYVVRAYSLVQE